MDIKPKKGITISVELEGYEKIKQQLRNLEATLDRILEKQERIRVVDFNPNDHKLLERIDNDCGRIVRMLQGKSTKDMDKVAEMHANNHKELNGIDAIIFDAWEADCKALSKQYDNVVCSKNVMPKGLSVICWNNVK